VPRWSSDCPGLRGCLLPARAAGRRRRRVRRGGRLRRRSRRLESVQKVLTEQDVWGCVLFPRTRSGAAPYTCPARRHCRGTEAPGCGARTLRCPAFIPEAGRCRRTKVPSLRSLEAKAHADRYSRRFTLLGEVVKADQDSRSRWEREPLRPDPRPSEMSSSPMGSLLLSWLRKVSVFSAVATPLESDAAPFVVCLPTMPEIEAAHYASLRWSRLLLSLGCH